MNYTGLRATSKDLAAFTTQKPHFRSPLTHAHEKAGYSGAAYSSAPRRHITGVVKGRASEEDDITDEIVHCPEPMKKPVLARSDDCVVPLGLKKEEHGG